MKRWLIIGLTIFIILTISLSVYVVKDTVNANRTVNDIYVKTGLTKTPLVQISSIEHYFGTEHLIIFFGQDEYEDEVIVWMKEDLSWIRHARLKDGIVREQIASLVKSTFDVKKEIHILPGMENELFIWEAVYQTINDEYLYAYYDFFTGDLLRSIKLRNH